MNLRNRTNSKQKKFYIESLGCPRNLVDSEIFAGLLRQNDCYMTDNPSEADLIIINTCGFIKDAKEESIEQILKLSELKTGNRSKLIVTGCLVKRYSDELRTSLPEIDHIIGLKDFENFISTLDLTPGDIRREALETASYAYLRISDGCNNHCSYCAIPSIRGGVKSEPLDKIIEEAGQLAERGAKEIIVTAMDITQYGTDLKNNSGLGDLLDRLDRIPGIEWIRLLYLHPAHITDELLYFIRDNAKICHYLDIPIQHISDKILKKMNRHTSRKDIEQLIGKIKRILPQAALRTTIITGFPGETEEDFRELMDFLSKVRFNRLGVFQYSAEQGTKACCLSGKVHHQTALRRKRELTELHDSISEDELRKYVGQTLEVIIDRNSEDESFIFEGRTRFDAPDIDGLVFIKAGYGKTGDIVKVKITESLVHDLIGIIEE